MAGRALTAVLRGVAVPRGPSAPLPRWGLAVGARGARRAPELAQGEPGGAHRACSSSSTLRSRSAKDEHRNPRTTYEGSDDTKECVLRAGSCGFTRANFVSCEQQRRRELKDKYSVGEEIGSGATATVYRAVNLRTNQEVALKAICKKSMPDPRMLRNEIAIHKVADHPNILRLLETFEDDDYLYLVAELCEGGDLRHHLNYVGDEFSVVKMPEEEALQIFQQVVASVRYLHMLGVVHRDLKPGNFLISATSRSSATSAAAPRRMIIKLTDFGVSTSCGIKHLLTRRVGTDGFMAPEVLKCQPYNEKADIFSIGCILHTLLFGNPPKRLKDDTYRIDMVRLRYVSSEMRSLLEWLIQNPPEDRPSIEEVAKLPLLRASQHRLRQTAALFGDQMLDQMYVYGSFPLLKKAALVAMVSRAESDADFLPSIEKFMSLGWYGALNSSIGLGDLYTAIMDELMGSMETLVQRTHGCRVTTETAKFSRGRCRRVLGRRRLRQQVGNAAMQHFREELRADLARILSECDTAQTNVLNYSEWLAATASSDWYTDAGRIRAVFKLLDYDQDGAISEDDLKNVLPDLFTATSVEAVLRESQLSAQSNSWIDEEHFTLLMRTQNPSEFTLRRIAGGVQEPLGVDRSSLQA